MSMPLYIFVFAPPYIYLFCIKFTMQTPMRGEEEKAAAAIFAAAYKVVIDPPLISVP